MASFTVKITAVCNGGCHVDMLITMGNNTTHKLSFAKEDFQIEPDELQQALPVLLKSFVKESGLTNWNQIKTALEGKVFKI